MTDPGVVPPNWGFYMGDETKRRRREKSNLAEQTNLLAGTARCAMHGAQDSSLAHIWWFERDTKRTTTMLGGPLKQDTPKFGHAQISGLEAGSDTSLQPGERSGEWMAVPHTHAGFHLVDWIKIDASPFAPFGGKEPSRV